MIKDIMRERIIENYNFKIKFRLMLKKRMAIRKMKTRNDVNQIQMVQEKMEIVKLLLSNKKTAIM